LGGRPKKPSELSENNPAGLNLEPTGKAIQTPDSRLQTKNILPTSPPVGEKSVLLGNFLAPPGRWTRIQADYPKFDGRQDWVNAQHFANLLVERGAATWEELHAAVLRYAAYCDGGGVASSRYVLKPGNFFSLPDKPWAQPWDLPNPTLAVAPSKYGRVRTTAELEAEEAAANANH
jgi:hypothetical protein